MRLYMRWCAAAYVSEYCTYVLNKLRYLRVVLTLILLALQHNGQIQGSPHFVIACEFDLVIKILHQTTKVCACWVCMSVTEVAMFKYSFGACLRLWLHVSPLQIVKRFPTVLLAEFAFSFNSCISNVTRWRRYLHRRPCSDMLWIMMQGLLYYHDIAQNA